LNMVHAKRVAWSFSLQEEKRRIIAEYDWKEKAEEEALAKMGRVKKKEKVRASYGGIIS
jgi:hypothetical protein